MIANAHCLILRADREANSLRWRCGQKFTDRHHGDDGKGHRQGQPEEPNLAIGVAQATDNSHAHRTRDRVKTHFIQKGAVRLASTKSGRKPGRPGAPEMKPGRPPSGRRKHAGPPRVGERAVSARRAGRSNPQFASPPLFWTRAISFFMPL